MGDFIFENGFVFDARILWNFKVGIYQIIINNVVVIGAAELHFTCEMNSFYRLTVYDRNDNIIAFTNADSCDNWIFDISKCPEYRIYNLDISKKQREVL